MYLEFKQDSGSRMIFCAADSATFVICSLQHQQLALLGRGHRLKAGDLAAGVFSRLQLVERSASGGLREGNGIQVSPEVR